MLYDEKKLLRYLKSQGCDLLREGAKHSWWHNGALNKKSAIPRHSEIKDVLVIKICKDLGSKTHKVAASNLLFSGYGKT